MSGRKIPITRLDKFFGAEDFDLEQLQDLNYCPRCGIQTRWGEYNA